MRRRTTTRVAVTIVATSTLRTPMSSSGNGRPTRGNIAQGNAKGKNDLGSCWSRTKQGKDAKHNETQTRTDWHGLQERRSLVSAIRISVSNMVSYNARGFASSSALWLI